ncbi:MAG TPA: SelB C-terminal domain-containing protein, partial [Acidimicrobiia bacterium]|nr:SelB C-terminal domain-containing protein [Acidimicrobiia bacterium]
HVAILELLGIRHGVVAISKADTVDDETLELAALELEERLPGRPAAAWPVVAVDSLSGRGLDELRAALDAVLAAAPAPRDVGRPRLWVDRVFSARGSGTIVTGTLTGGALHVDHDVIVEPGHRSARVRRIESQHAQLEGIGPGSRVALNLSGVDHHDITRGDAVVRPEHWAVVSTVDVALQPLPGTEFPHGGTVDAHVGSGDHVARLSMLDDESQLARLRFDTALPLAPGDRIVLRSSARQSTIAGAEVLDVAPARRAADARTRRGLPLSGRVLAARPWATTGDFVALAGVADGDTYSAQLVDEGLAVRVGSWVLAPEHAHDLRERARALVTTRDPSTPGVTLAALASALGIDASQLRALLAGDDALAVERDLVREAGASRVESSAEAQALLAALDEKPFEPPSPAGLGAAPGLVRALVGAGVLVDLDGVVLTANAFASARALVVDALRENEAMTVAALRDVLGTSRKYALPILNRLDAEGVTRRRGDDRVLGPRAEQLD